MYELTDKEKTHGVVYTPSDLADYVAKKVLKYYFESAFESGQSSFNINATNYHIIENLRIVDPACGSGELLISAWKALIHFISKKRDSISLVDSLDPNKILYGIDIDGEALDKAKSTIMNLSNGYKNEVSFNLCVRNALYPIPDKSSREGWVFLNNQFQLKNGFDILIANPPWGAEVDSYKHILSNGEYSLYKRQYDTSDLFIELALEIVKPGGYFAFIIPDSLFAQERVDLRKLILERTEIKYIGRLGEKIFPNINRSCAVVICRKGIPSDSNVVDCFRLSAEFRKEIIKGEKTYEEADSQLIHKVKQSRFKNNKEYKFDIYLKSEEEELFALFSNHDHSLGDYLSNSRGVEISKYGRICQCNHCGKWLPYPRSKTPKCLHCKEPIQTSEVEDNHIIVSQPDDNSEPIIVGEDIKRFSINKCNWILKGKTGIN